VVQKYAEVTDEAEMTIESSRNRVTHDTSRALRRSAIGFALMVGYTSAVAIRDDLPGRPFGVGVPFSVSTGILVGWGAGVAAPWPIPAAVLVAARRANEGSSAAALTCAALGIATICGYLVEPNTYNRKTWATRANRNAILSGVSASAALATAGLQHWKHLGSTRRPALPAG
jgi:hypothetical protein